MDKKQLYNSITERKIKPQDFEPYNGNNGRVNKCVQLFKNGTLNTGGCLLDVGGGIGDLGASLVNDFDLRICIDISEKNLEAARAKGNETYLADIDKDGIPIRTFPPAITGGVGVVTALDFIEHIIDPEYFARECFRVLKSGGQVFINTPNIRFWKHIQQLWVGGSFPHTSGDREVYHGGHLAFFTFRDLCDIFSVAGFKDFEQIKDEEGYITPPPWALNPLKIADQQEFVKINMELGCPNLLFKCVKP